MVSHNRLHASRFWRPIPVASIAALSATALLVAGCSSSKSKSTPPSSSAPTADASASPTAATSASAPPGRQCVRARGWVGDPSGAVRTGRQPDWLTHHDWHLAVADG